MKAVFNETEEFFISRAGEQYSASADNKFKINLQIVFYNDNENFNRFLNYINSNSINKIEIYDNLNQKIYTTTENIKCNNIYRNIQNEIEGFVQVTFIKND